MPKKIGSVKKSRSSKPISNGMIDIEELKRIIDKEESKELWRRVELSNKNIEIEKLKEQVKWPDYHRKQHIPVTDLVQIHTADREEMRLDNLMKEVDNITAFALGLLTTFVGGIIFILMVLFVSVSM